MATISGGEKLERALAEIARKLARPATLRVGFFEDATYPDGTPVAMVAAIQDYGAPGAGIPPRPFFRNMIAAKRDGWAPAIAALLKQNDGDVHAALMSAGEGIKSQLQQSIRDTNAPPLAESTIRRKGSSKPLIDSGKMFNSVGYHVND